MKCLQVPLKPCLTFKPICIRLTTSNGPIVLLDIYRPGSARPSASFFDELCSVIEVLVTFSCPVLVGRNINVHVEDTADVDARRLSELLANARSRISGPTLRPLQLRLLKTRRHPRGTPPSGELNTRGVAEYSDFGPIERYISETVQDRS